MKIRCDRTIALSTVSLVALFSSTLIGCSADENAPANSSTSTLPDYGYGGTESGGAGANTGGTQAETGGSSAAQTTASANTGGSGSGGNAAETGGRSTASNTGGTEATGGSANAGGSKQTGGSKSMGGANTGGGTRATGGASANIGGSKSTGGSVGAGGTKSTGGAPNTGGTKLTGGAPNTGGSKSTGGAPNTGGASAAAGSSSVGFDWGTDTYNPTGGQNVGHQGHRTGEGCLASCHSHRFTVGGTIYQSNGTSTASNVEIGVIINGTLYTGYSGSQGNFYFSGVPSSANWATAEVAIRTASGTSVHPATSGLSGNCNSCHGSSNRIVVP